MLVFLQFIAHKGLSFPATQNFDRPQNQNLKFELLFRIEHAALSDIRSETKLTCAIYKLLLYFRRFYNFVS